jgi:hypothetical protein
VAAGAASGGDARANTPGARLGLLTGVRLQLSSLGDDYAYAAPWGVIGFEAAYLPGESSSGRLRLGFAWWTTITVYAATSTTAVDAELSTTEMGLGLRLSYQVPVVTLPLFVYAQGGPEILRTSTPLMDDGRRSFFGAAAAAGAELGVGDVFLGVAAHVAPIGSGPSAASVFVTLAFGRP